VFFPSREYWLVLDHVTAAEEHRADIHFHAAEGVTATVVDRASWLTLKGPKCALDIAYPARRGHWDVTAGQISPCYGLAVETPTAQYSVRAGGGIAALSVLMPRPCQDLPAQIQELDHLEEHGFQIVGAQYRDTVLRGTQVTRSGQFMCNECDWVWIRHGSPGAIFDKIIVVHGMAIEVDGLHFRLSRAADFVVISRQNELLTIEISEPMDVLLRPPPGVTRVALQGSSQVVKENVEITILAQGATDISVASAPESFSRCKYVRN
jgi:hypothetical protein